MSIYIYVLIESEGAYSDRDWKVRGVFSTREKAILNGFKMLLESALKPWIIPFYKNRDGEFANLNALPELHIEKWSIDGEKNENIYIGFMDRPFKHFISEFLKKREVESKDSENILGSWKDSLDNNIIPNDLMNFIRIE